MNEPFYTKKIYTIEELKEKLTPIFDSAPVYKAILFGSYARGEANEKSDVDIIIDSRGELLNFNFFGVMGYSEEAVEKYVDMYEISELLEGSPVLASINNNEGVVIYER
ncbi:MAG: nucleotidyltransferase domain-containing protein [Firmicutes bacterium]|nr:nucleotidyltransferase domain-containing protein [Bacillota bacterium]